jgi:hypothetical protein
MNGHVCALCHIDFLAVQAHKKASDISVEHLALLTLSRDCRYRRVIGSLTLGGNNLKPFERILSSGNSALISSRAQAPLICNIRLRMTGDTWAQIEVLQWQHVE